jgi:hypothetical protein
MNKNNMLLAVLFSIVAPALASAELSPTYCTQEAAHESKGTIGTSPGLTKVCILNDERSTWLEVTTHAKVQGGAEKIFVNQYLMSQKWSDSSEGGPDLHVKYHVYDNQAPSSDDMDPRFVRYGNINATVRNFIRNPSRPAALSVRLEGVDPAGNRLAAELSPVKN